MTWGGVAFADFHPSRTRRRRCSQATQPWHLQRCARLIQSPLSLQDAASIRPGNPAAEWDFWPGTTADRLALRPRCRYLMRHGGGVDQLVRSSPCHGEGCGFEPRRSRQLPQPFAPLARAPRQRGARRGCLQSCAVWLVATILLIRERPVPGIAFNGARAAHVGELALFILPEHKRTDFREVLLQPIFGVSSAAARYFQAAPKMLARGSSRWGFR